jgi:protein-disulfide isomerase
MKNGRVSVWLLTISLAAALALGAAVGRGLGGMEARAKPEKAAQPQAATAQAATAEPVGEKRYAVPVSHAQPWIGGEDALVTIVEWCDLPDAACAELEPKLQELVKANESIVRFVSRHYTTSGQAPSVRAHQFTRVAHERFGKFWAARALMLGHQGELKDADLEGYATQLGMNWDDARKLLDAGEFTSAIKADRLFSTMFEVHATPGIFINGRSLGDHPTSARLAQVFDEESKHAVDMMVNGISKSDVYAEVTKKGTWKPADLSKL